MPDMVISLQTSIPHGNPKLLDQVRDVIRRAPAEHEPLVIIVEAAEELREEELAVVLDAAARAQRRVIVRVMADA